MSERPKLSTTLAELIDEFYSRLDNLQLNDNALTSLSGLGEGFSNLLRAMIVRENE